MNQQTFMPALVHFKQQQTGIDIFMIMIFMIMIFMIMIIVMIIIIIMIMIMIIMLFFAALLHRSSKMEWRRKKMLIKH